MATRHNARRAERITIRMKPTLAEALRAESSRRGVSTTALVTEALERALLGSPDEVQMQLLRSVFIVRELVSDMSGRSDKDKEKLWQAMTDYTSKLLTSS